MNQIELNNVRIIAEYDGWIFKGISENKEEIFIHLNPTIGYLNAISLKDMKYHEDMGWLHHIILKILKDLYKLELEQESILRNSPIFFDISEEEKKLQRINRYIQIIKEYTFEPLSTNNLINTIINTIAFLNKFLRK